MFLERIGQVRSRDGALFWGHFIDAADPSRHVENFIATKRLEHLRRHARVTLADRALEEELRAFQQGGEAPVITHLAAARGTFLAVGARMSLLGQSVMAACRAKVA
jgi:hypothetical protein